MNQFSNEVTGLTTTSRSALPGETQQDCTTVFPGDIRHPWKSVYGFPMTAARLAASQGAIISCREDEILDYLAQLNDLLRSPESLNQAYLWLEKLAQETRQKLGQLLKLREQPIDDSEIAGLVAQIEDNLARVGPQTVTDRLASVISPDDPTREIAGLRKRLARLQTTMAALAKIKDRGFKVVVVDRHRQLKCPALAASQNAAGQPGNKQASFSAPVEYHLTLWTYRVVRSDRGQSAVWN